MVALDSESEEAKWQSFKRKDFSASFVLGLNMGSWNNKAWGKILWGRKGKSREAESSLVVAGGWNGNREDGKWPQGCLGEDGDVLKLDFGDGWAMLWILWYINDTLVKLFKKNTQQTGIPWQSSG